MSAIDKSSLSIGLIGMGEMGKMYADRLSKGGWTRINVCDKPENFDKISAFAKDLPGVTVLSNGHLVSRVSDFIVYSVEAEFIDRIVEEYGPSTKLGAIVAGQTSVKAPEKQAFEAHLPEDVHIVSIHSLHAPSVAPDGQALVIIPHRAPEDKVQVVETVLACLNSRFVRMTYEEHDEITANTQAGTHAAFLSMGTAWQSMQSFPWETGRYIGGIEVAKINITLRIYAAQWHIYAGLAILNPMARKQIDQYAKSVTDLFKLMVEEKEDELRERVFAARDFVFGTGGGSPQILLSDKILDQFAIGTAPAESSAPPPNSHLSLLAMADAWRALGLNPFRHLELAATPVFRLWLGVAEYLFRSPERLEAAVVAAIHDRSHRSDDTEFVIAARGWSQCVSYGDFEVYRDRFQTTSDFFKPRFPESRETNKKMMQALAK